MFALLFGISLLLIGGGAAIVGWRHRRSLRVGEHPYCVRCDRDLHGLLAATTERCPECGADLTVHGAALFGKPHANRRAQILSFLIAAGCLLSAWFALRAVDYPQLWLEIEPTSWVMSKAMAPGTSGPNLAARELDRRIQGGRYSGERLGHLVEALNDLHLSGRATVRLGEQWPMVLDCGPRGMFWSSSDPKPTLYVAHQLSRYRFGNRPWVDTSHYTWMRRGVAGFRDQETIEVPGGLPPGPTTVEMVVSFALIEDPTGDIGHFGPYPEPAAQLDPHGVHDRVDPSAGDGRHRIGRRSI